ncbi:MAG: glycerophosphodiester phosphodiesterase [Victivallaceae bacterium]
MISLDRLHESPEVLWTAHRGASYDEPENTMVAFERAIAAGADFIEFDLRMSRDGVPVVLHDSTIDRTSDGCGRPGQWTLAELKRYNFSYYRYGERASQPHYSACPIPTFEEVLQSFRNRAAMNIQVYADPSGVDKICRLYCDYDMSDRGYLTIADLSVAESVRRFAPEIQICLTPGWHERAEPENLRLSAAIGCRFVQPTAESVSAETFQLCRQLKLRPNLFVCDSAELARQLVGLGANGLMTNRIVELGSVFRQP